MVRFFNVLYLCKPLLAPNASAILLLSRHRLSNIIKTVAAAADYGT
jgi:hypothetical protein